MLSTSQVEKVNTKGKTVTEWVVTGKDDHFWDCETYAYALSSAFGLGGALIKKSPTTITKASSKNELPESFWDGSDT